MWHLRTTRKPCVHEASTIEIAGTLHKMTKEVINPATISLWHSQHPESLILFAITSRRHQPV